MYDIRNLTISSTNPCLIVYLLDQSGSMADPFDNGDYGYITTRTDLQDLEVLVLEITPSRRAVRDEDVIKAYLEKWFKEMNVKNFAIYNTDLPSNTQVRIEKFLNNQ